MPGGILPLTPPEPTTAPVRDPDALNSLQVSSPDESRVISMCVHLIKILCQSLRNLYFLSCIIFPFLPFIPLSSPPLFFPFSSLLIFHTVVQKSSSMQRPYPSKMFPYIFRLIVSHADFITIVPYQIFTRPLLVYSCHF